MQALSQPVHGGPEHYRNEYETTLRVIETLLGLFRIRNWGFEEKGSTEYRGEHDVWDEDYPNLGVGHDE
jgi:hypothetical protein